MRKRLLYYEGLKLGRIWSIGWTERKDYVLSKWIFSFCYFKKMVWQIRILGFYITSTNKNSVRNYGIAKERIR